MYVAITAGLFAVRFGSATPPPGAVSYAPWAGIGFGAVFGIFEVVASYKYREFADRVIELESSDGPIFRGKRVRWFGLITSATVLIYGGLVAFWICIA